MQKPHQLAANRPAETSGLAGAVGVLIAWAAGVDNAAVIAALGIVVGAIPAVVTGAVVWTRRHA